MSGESTKDMPIAGSVVHVTTAERMIVSNTLAKQKARRAGKMTNAEYAATNQQFRAACSEEGLEPTARQASKYRARKGRAFYSRSAHLAVLRSKKLNAENALVTLRRQFQYDKQANDETIAEQTGRTIRAQEQHITDLDRRWSALTGAHSA